MGGKGRVVAAAVFRMKNESQIENFCFKLGIFFIGSQKQENVLGGAQMPVGFVNKQAFFFIIVIVCLIAVDSQYGEQSDKLYALTQNVRNIQGVCVVIIRIKGQNRP